eukprot:scaffold358319_cov56-Prasinocladus_malaysianus.AAC.1
MEELGTAFNHSKPGCLIMSPGSWQYVAEVLGGDVLEDGYARLKMTDVAKTINTRRTFINGLAKSSPSVSTQLSSDSLNQLERTSTKK